MTHISANRPALVGVRDILVRARAAMISTLRGMVKSFGHRLPSCSTESFAKKVKEHIPAELLRACHGSNRARPLLRALAKLTEEIALLGRQITQLSKTKYPETQLLQQVPGVGPVTALSFVLTLKSPERFKSSRQVGAYLGLVPRQDQSGDVDKQLRKTQGGQQLRTQTPRPVRSLPPGPLRARDGSEAVGPPIERARWEERSKTSRAPTPRCAKVGCASTQPVVHR